LVTDYSLKSLPKKDNVILLPIIPQNPFKKHGVIWLPIIPNSLQKTQCDLAYQLFNASLQKTNKIWLTNYSTVDERG
jgi:hypothetical protein